MSNAGYANKQAWDARYRENENLFEWYAPFDYLQERLQTATGINASSQVLVLGCGTSGLSAALFDSVCKNITSVDFSSTAINLQKQRNESRPGMTFEVQDIRKLSAGAGKYDVVIAKATIDAVLCSDGANANIKAALDEASRVLAPGGTFVVYSHSPPEERLSHFEREAYKWTVTSNQFVRPSITEVEGLPDDNPDNLLFEYVMKKA